MVTSQQDIREKIIDVASNIFAKFGFKKTTLEEIAEAIHKGKSSLYYYFNSKEEIFREVVEKESSLLNEAIKRSVDIKDSPHEKIRAYFITRTKEINRLANFYNVLKDEYLDHYTSIEKIREKHFSDEHKMIKVILKYGVDRGIFVIKNIELTSQAIINALKGFEYGWAVESDFTKIERSIDSLLEILFYGLTKR